MLNSETSLIHENIGQWCQQKTLFVTANIGLQIVTELSATIMGYKSKTETCERIETKCNYFDHQSY